MKKIILTVISFFVLVSVSTLRAGNDGLSDGLLLRKKSSKNRLFLGLPNRTDGGEQSFGNGKIALSLGYGAASGGFLKVLLKTYEDEAGYNFTSFGPIHFRGELGISDNVGLVCSINHNSWKASWTHLDSSISSPVYYDEVKRSVISVLARLNFHFGVSERVDPYFGVGAGYRAVDFSYTSTDPTYDWSFSNPFHLGFETTVGVRYYLTDGIGLYGEIGLAQALLQGGLVVSF